MSFSNRIIAEVKSFINVQINIKVSFDKRYKFNYLILLIK
jgi:hypothetical protein